MAEPSINHLTDHLFRHEAGKMVSVLTRIFGSHNLETAEDVVQQTFVDAIRVWKLRGVPDNPPAWLFRVAKNKAIDVLRRNKHSVSYDFHDESRALLTSEYTLHSTMDTLWQEDAIHDDMLRLMFACCHPAVSQENHITIILKTLCSFSTAEIAHAFMCPEDTISKRLYRTKQIFRQQKIKLELPAAAELKHRSHSVLKAIYLIFNEGYNSTHSDEHIRADLIGEAIRLCELLISNPHTQFPECFALMALMHFHAARSSSRITTEGDIILLAEQDRSMWDGTLIEQAQSYLDLSASGDDVSTYHIEAAIAFEHCIAATFAATNWGRILELYEWLYRISPSALVELNMAAVQLQTDGAEQTLERLQHPALYEKLKDYYLYWALLGDVFLQLGRKVDAHSSYERASAHTRSQSEQRLLHGKIARLRED